MDESKKLQESANVNKKYIDCCHCCRCCAGQCLVNSPMEPSYESRSVSYKGRLSTYTVNTNGEPALMMLFRWFLFYFCCDYCIVDHSDNTSNC